MELGECTPSSASHSRHSQLNTPKATETALLPQLEQSPELHKEGWIQDSGPSPADYPIYSQWAAAMEKWQQLDVFASPGMMHNP